MSNVFTFSIGKKLVMALMGLFLCAFLVVHLGINLALIFSSTTEAFNKAAHFMGTNPVVKAMEIGLFGGIFLHILYAAILTLKNWIARPVGYKIGNNQQTSFFSKYMVHTAVIVAIFLVLHLFDFYVKAKFQHGFVNDVVYDGKTYHDLGTLVLERFKIGWVVVVYVIALLGLGFHLIHGFQSAFQTMGLNHPVYTPIIKAVGYIYSVAVTLGFIAIPVAVYFFK
ncbi:MAG: succinate dehydrogenase cytochrome b subunit [Bacteroidales bacterium]|nr:succinate dehydrogenase cytochrome b subunit [Bacteroidales bacterium]